MADAIVVGGGLEGLTAAAFLAKAGRRVCVLEASETLGGVHAGSEIAPGFRAPGVAHDVAGARREVLAPLGLDVAWRDPAPLLVADGDEGLWIHRDVARTQAGLSSADADAYGRWRATIERWAPIVRRVLDERPPEIATPSIAELWDLARTGLALRKLGERDMLELMRVAPMAARDWMEERFESPRLAAGLVAPALLATTVGPRAAGTCAAMLLRESAAGREPEGGPAALVDALVARCKSAGVELRTGAAVERIRLEEGRATGVLLAGGETVDASLVVSALDFATTMLDRIDSVALPLELEQAAKAWKRRGAIAAVRLALSEPPAFAAAGGEPVERACTARDLVQLERAADALKYGDLPEDPWLDARVFPAEKGAVVSLLVHGVPRALRGGWDDAARERVGDRAVDAFERAAPGTGANLVARDVLTPVDVEARFGLAGGHLFGGELGLDQLWFQRPCLPCGRYATPIEGLWLAGPSSHPGGPYPGGAGALAAAAIG